MYVDNDVIDEDSQLSYRFILTGRESGDEVSESTAYTYACKGMEGSLSSRNGFKNYLPYIDMDTPQGTLSVEESSGNLIYSQDDFDVSNSQLDYGLSRAWQSGSTFSGMLGTGWSDSYHMELYDDGTDVIFADSDGSIYRFVNGVCAESEEMMLHIDTDGSKEVRFKDGTIYSFDTYGRLAYVSELNGNTVTNTYDSLGRLSRVTSNAGSVGSRSLEMQYDGDSYLLEEIEDFCGSEYHYSYDSAGRLNEAEVSDGEISGGSVSNEYEYDTSGKMVSVSDRCGNEYGVSYGSGKVVSMTYPNGDSYGLEYGSGSVSVEKRNLSGDLIYEEGCTFDTSCGKLLTTTSVDGNVTGYSYSSAFPFLESAIESDTQWESISDTGVVTVHDGEKIEAVTYDSSGNISSETDENGIVTTYSYTGDLVTGETERYGDTVLSDYDYEYNDEGNVVSETDTIAGTRTEYIYDSYGNERKCTQKKLAGGEYVTVSVLEYICDSDGNELSESSSSGKIRSSISSVYDSQGRVISYTENGLTTSISYDYLGRKVSETSTKGTGTTTYTSNGSIASETDAAGLTKTYIYDSLNRVISVTKSGNGIQTCTESISYGYEILNEKLCYTESHYDNSGNLYLKTYTDGAGRVIRELSGVIYTDYTYDGGGNVLLEKTGSLDPECDDVIVTASVTDENGNEIAGIQNPEVSRTGVVSTGEDAVVTEAEYDIQGNVISETDGEGNETVYEYDSRGRLTGVDAVQGVTELEITYEDEGAGEQVIREGAAGSITESSFNSAGLETSVTDLEADTEDESLTVGKTYNSDGNLIREKYDDGSYLEYTYDSRGNVTERKSYYEADSIEETVTYTYDSTGNVTGTVKRNSAGSLICEKEFSYDCMGRVISETADYGSDEKTVTYTYDAKGLLSTVNYPSGSGISSVSYIYDAYERLTEIRKGNDKVAEYTYDGLGRTAAERIYSEPGESEYIEKQYTYDDMGRTDGIIYFENGSTERESFEYGYDDRGYITSRVHETSYGEDDVQESITYCYDADGRLERSIVSGVGGRTLTYEYDAEGNRLKMDDGDVSTKYDYNGLNQLEKATCVDMDSNEEISVTEYTYDDRGNLIEEIETDSVSGTESARVYEYSVMGEMLSVSDGGSVIQSNCYDESGSRISKTEGGSTKQYYYSGGRLIYIDGDTDTSGVIDPSGNMISAYFGTEYGIYCEDVQGSTYSILDSEFDTACRYSYMDFGETEEVTAEFDNEICYTGAVYDETTGLYYMNARYYNPEAGRFISQDTYRGEDEDPGTWHLYAYCSNNPINYTDPSGHKRRQVGFGMQATISIGRGYGAVGVSIAFIWFNSSVDQYENKSFHVFTGTFGEIGASKKNSATKELSDNADKMLNGDGLKKIKESYCSRNKKKLNGAHVAVSAGFFIIYGDDSFAAYGDYAGRFGCVSVSFLNTSITFATGKSNIDVGAAITTEKRVSFSVSYGKCSFRKGITDSVRSVASGMRNSVKKKAA